MLQLQKKTFVLPVWIIFPSWKIIAISILHYVALTIWQQTLKSQWPEITWNLMLKFVKSKQRIFKWYASSHSTQIRVGVLKDLPFWHLGKRLGPKKPFQTSDLSWCVWLCGVYYEAFYGKSYIAFCSQVFSVLFSIVITSLWEDKAGRHGYASRAFVSVSCMRYSVIFLFLLVSGIGCGLWLWHSLDFSFTCFEFSESCYGNLTYCAPKTVCE